MPYETFERTGIRVDTPAVSIGQSGKVVLNAAATRILDEVGAKSVFLLWDKTKQRIAIKVAPEGDKNAFAASKTTSSTHVRCKAFLRYIGWAPRNRTALDASWNQKEEMFEIALLPAHLKS